MHVGIPDFDEIYTPNTNIHSYTGYNVYINGVFHCCIRYSQLYNFHEELRRRCNELEIQLPVFPPRKLLPLTSSQLETRRIALENYLQLVGQDGRIAKLEYVQNFLLNAQVETFRRFKGQSSRHDIEEEHNDDEQNIQRDTMVQLDVALMSGYQLKINNCRIGNNASALLRQACDLLRLPKHLMPYFCLFLGRIEAQDTLVLWRLLMDFESPYLSRLQAPSCQILLRKCYWDPSYDMHLLQDTTALNLLYVQTVSDVEREWIIASPEVRQKLNGLQNHGLKKEYLEMARQLPLYGCLQFAESAVDYPDHDTTALISIGNKELSMRTAKGQKIYETKFRVTRMRCWRVTAVHNTQQEEAQQRSDGGRTVSSHTAPTNLQLAFEYLMSKQTLRWITIASAQAMLMSVCLQSMVDELMATKKDAVANPTTTMTNHPTSRNGRIYQSQSASFLSSSSSTPSFNNEPLSSTSTSTTSSTSSSSSPTVPVKFIAQDQRRAKHNPKILSAASYAAVFFRNAQAQDDESVHNEAFEGIGDDDL